MVEMELSEEIGWEEDPFADDDIDDPFADDPALDASHVESTNQMEWEYSHYTDDDWKQMNGEFSPCTDDDWKRMNGEPPLIDDHPTDEIIDVYPRADSSGVRRTQDVPGEQNLRERGRRLSVNDASTQACATTSPDDSELGDSELGDWELPISFGVQKLPTFPIEALPAAIGDYVSSVAAATQVPVDMAAVMALTTVAAAGARRCFVQIGNTHSEPLNLYTMVVMEPGNRKSAIVDACVEPLRQSEKALISAKTETYQLTKETREQEIKRLEHVRNKITKEEDEDERRRLKEDAEFLVTNMTEVSELPCLLADDFTPEALMKLMADQEDNSMAIINAEGGIFATLGGRYNSGVPNLDLILKGHTGEMCRVNRVNQPPRTIERPTLTMGLAVQLAVLESLAQSPTFRGRGLLGRFLYALPEDLVGYRVYPAPKLDEAAKARYSTVIQSLIDIPFIKGDAGAGTRYELLLTNNALAIWTEFYNDVEARQRDGRDLNGIRDWASKLAGAVARIAGNLHLVEHHASKCPWDTLISDEAVVGACKIGNYLIEHALAAFKQMGADPAYALAQRILKWIDRDCHHAFSLRDLTRAYPSITRAEIENAIAVLVRNGFIRAAEQTTKGAGRPRSPVYIVNPLHLSTRGNG